MKDYKTILEGVVNIINTTEKSDIGFANICTYIGENCPELKESEDEKIRKDLIIYLRSILSNKKYGDKFIEGWIAWLEKLGGKKSKTPDENIIDCIGMCLTDADEQRFKDYNTNLKDCLSWLEKQGEAWNEEDEYYYGIVQYILNNERVGKADKENASNWFKSIKDRVQPQPKQEWSEEDEQRVENLLAIIEGHGYPGEVAWLKSLKERCCPQKHWKPTEEMLEALYRIIPQDVMEKSEDEILLDKLYQGLKYGRILSK